MRAVVDVPAQETDFATSAASACDYRVPHQYIRLADALVQVAAFFAAYYLVPVVQPLIATGGALHVDWLAWLSLPAAPAPEGFRPLASLLWIPVLTIPATLLAVDVLGGYAELLDQSRTRVVTSSIAGPLVGLAWLSLLLLGAKNWEISRAFIFTFGAATALGFLVHRAGVRIYKRKRLARGYYARNVLAIGSASAIAALGRHFSQKVRPELFRLVGYLAVSHSPSPSRKAAGDVPLVGHLTQLGDILVHRPVHQVIAVESNGAAWLRDVAEVCDYFHLTLRIVPESLLLPENASLRPATTGPLYLPEIVVRAQNFHSDALFMKRLIDVFVSGFLLIVLSPVFLLIALAVKLTTPRLPVFYPWRVVGYKGRTFTGYKFTTMVADADEKKAELMPLNEMSGPVFKIKDDPRVTPLGRLLRKFSLNELPQLWSVLKGDMSLVGPRPAYPHELERYELWHKRKLCVQPGITCLWQIRGRNKIASFEDWVRMDFEYMDNWSLWLDFRILVRTVWAVLTGSGC